MQSHDVEMTEIFWGDHVLQLVLSGRVEDALRFTSENEARLNSWQHGFCSKFFSTVPTEHSKDLFLKLAEQCPVDDIVFDLIEVSNDLDTITFFDIVLPSYLVLLSRNPNQKYLDWFIGMIKTRLVMLSSTDVESSYIKTSFDNIATAAKFFQPFTHKVRCLLVSELLSYFLKDENIKSHAVRILNNFLPDPFFLVSYLESGLTEKPTQKYNPILDSSVVSLRAVCLYFSSRVLNCDFPLIYSPQYLLVSSLPILHQLLMKDDFIDLGLEIFAHFAGNETRFGVHDLTPDFTKCISALNNVMIYNQTKERRDEAFRLFNFLMSSLDDKGLYQMLLNYRNQVNHPSTISYLMSQIKKSFMDPNNAYFKGKRLFDVLKLYASIDKGINLLDEHVRIVTTLNFFWYLIGCHKRKSLHLDESFFQFMYCFGDIVEELIAKARLEQQASLRELQKGNDCNLAVTMYDKSLPELSNQQKMDSILSVRNVIDVVEHNLEAFNTYCKQ